MLAAAPGWALIKAGLQVIWPNRLGAGPIGVMVDGVLHAAMGALNSVATLFIVGNGASDFRLALPGAVAGFVAFAVERLIQVAFPPSSRRAS